jgi:hypothetical protein
MFKKTITYRDLEGTPITEDFYFHLSKAEIAEMELSRKGGLSEFLKEIVASEDGKAIIETFKEIVVKSYGIRSPDKKRFIKSKEISDEFLQTDAYSELFIELVTDAESSAAFIRGIVPIDLAAGLASSSLNIPLVRAVEDVSLPTLTTDDERKRLEERLAELNKNYISSEETKNEV